MPSKPDTCPGELALPRNHSDYTLALLAAKTPEELDALEEQAEAHHDIAEQEAHMCRRIVWKIRARRLALTHPKTLSRFKATVLVIDGDAHRTEEQFCDAASRELASDIINARMRSVCTGFSIQRLERVGQ